ncbi:hypothetical protein LOZ53_004767 [Ophidiomyces ophidiicola]|nr:hypothetical protein LOZ55_004764 [Ophidiomyces ophidiicola]KAI1979623.1 hypothetical protein LOZ54_006019 [Ophidiomyces ophidiicola]KAI1986279.1 hypothetical protein LOZ53_004767 [Ophidiomyces ophidiicola]KAI1998481.1 hypothetical protein LOZ51_002212 [Ophidiomyces ophidiicola]
MAPRILTQSASPLKIRTSLHRLRSCPSPWKLLWKLLQPYPLRFRPPAALPVSDLQQNGARLLALHQAGLLQLYEIPLFRLRDTPLRSLYRLYEDLCADNLILMSYECEYLFFHPETRWQLSQIPDPKDKNHMRYALLASMVEALVDAFNWRLDLGLRRDKSINYVQSEEPYLREQAPSWALEVGPLAEPLVLTHSQKNSQPNEAFAKRNIQASMGYLYTV